MRLEEKLDMAFSQSNRRWLNKGWVLDTPALKTCLEPDECPMSRQGQRCISQWCILRFPEEQDMEVLR